MKQDIDTKLLVNYILDNIEEKKLYYFNQHSIWTKGYALNNKGDRSRYFIIQISSITYEIQAVYSNCTETFSKYTNIKKQIIVMHDNKTGKTY